MKLTHLIGHQRTFYCKWEGQVFSDKISAYPIKLNGYDDYFPIATKDAKVLLNTEIQEYDLEKKTVN